MKNATGLSASIAVAFLVLIGLVQPAFSSELVPTLFEIDPAVSMTNDEAKLKVEELLKNTKIAKREYFCVKREISCRTHYTLTDLGGNLIDAFYVRFVAVDRSVGGNGYFFPVKGQPTKFVRIEDFSFDGKLNIDAVMMDNLVTVEKSKTGSVSVIRNILTPRLGTTKVTNATITVEGKKTVLEGLMYDTADASFSEKVRIEYLRTNVTR